MATPSLREQQKHRYMVAGAVLLVCVLQFGVFLYVHQNPASRLQRRSWFNAVSTTIMAGNVCAILGCLTTFTTVSLVPWIVVGLVKVVLLVMESIYGAVGHKSMFILSIVFSHWGVFCLIAWSMFISSECAEETANVKLKGGQAAVDASSSPHFDSGGYSSYAAGGADDGYGGGGDRGASSAGTMQRVLFGLRRVLAPVPVLGDMLGKVEKSQKRQQFASV